MYETARDGLTFDAQSTAAARKLSREPSEYFASNCFLGGPLDLRASYDAGTPNLMFGADLPHGEGTSPYTLKALRCMLAGLSEQTVRNITSATAADVYGFDLDLLANVAARVGPPTKRLILPCQCRSRRSSRGPPAAHVRKGSPTGRFADTGDRRREPEATAWWRLVGQRGVDDL